LFTSHNRYESPKLVISEPEPCLRALVAGKDPKSSAELVVVDAMDVANRSWRKLVQHLPPKSISAAINVHFTAARVREVLPEEDLVLCNAEV